MTIYDPEGNHSKYTSTARHWCPYSETRYTGADSLLTAQRNGWEMAGYVFEETIHFSHNRYTTVYHFLLMRDQDARFIPVLHNPFVARMLRQRPVKVLPAKVAPVQPVEERTLEPDEVDAIFAV